MPLKNPKTDSSSPCLILIRHAERFDLESSEDSSLVLLTEKGRRDAYSLGGELELLQPVDIYHSPVSRCRETAEEIHRAMKDQGRRTFLKGPALELGGFFLKGKRETLKTELMSRGNEGFTRMWFDGKLGDDLLLGMENAAGEILDYIIRRLHDTEGSSVNITHDWNIMIVREYFFGLRHEDIDIPAFLDGFSARVTGSSIHLRYHEHERFIPLPLTAGKDSRNP
jgi:broad specificity phosphatase PhoE